MAKTTGAKSFRERPVFRRLYQVLGLGDWRSVSRLWTAVLKT
jgi:hypothetical protein